MSLRQGADIFDSLKKQDKALGTDDSKLSVRQRSVLHLNRCLLLLVGKQADKCREELEVLIQQMPDSEYPHLVLAALAYREKNPARAVAILSVCTCVGLALIFCVCARVYVCVCVCVCVCVELVVRPIYGPHVVATQTFFFSLTIHYPSFIVFAQFKHI